MKAKVKTNEIGKGLKACVNATELKDDLRKCIQFNAENGKLKISACNSSYSYSYSCDADVEEDGFAVVDGRTVYSVISKASDDCTFKTTGSSMIVKGCGKTTLPDIGREIPIAETNSGDHVVCDSVEFKNAVSKIIYAISEDQSKVILTGAHLVTDGQFATITALDGFRLAQTSFPCNGDVIDVVVPARTLADVCEPITSGSLDIYANSNRISFSFGDFYFNSLLLSGKYIDTEKLIPKEFKTKSLAKTQDIKNMIDLAMIASGKNNLVRLSFTGDKMYFASSDTAEFEGDIDALVDGDTLQIAFNLRYLSHAINHITTERCVIHMNTSVTPAVITPHTNDTVPDIHLLLPVRTVR